MEIHSKAVIPQEVIRDEIKESLSKIKDRISSLYSDGLMVGMCSDLSFFSNLCLYRDIVSKKKFLWVEYTSHKREVLLSMEIYYLHQRKHLQMNVYDEKIYAVANEEFGFIANKFKETITNATVYKLYYKKVFSW